MGVDVTRGYAFQEIRSGSRTDVASLDPRLFVRRDASLRRCTHGTGPEPERHRSRFF